MGIGFRWKMRVVGGRLVLFWLMEIEMTMGMVVVRVVMRVVMRVVVVRVRRSMMSLGRFTHD